MQDFQHFSDEQLLLVEHELLTAVDSYTKNDRLKESMRYSIAAGGKRIRPLLVLATVQAFNQPLTTSVYQTAAALEMIHTYSLIHDDLPAMDDDDYRRGQLTNHKQYDEATAILAGDGLLTLAFQVLSETALPAEKTIALIQELAAAAGVTGMVAGQAADMQAENRQVSLEALQAIHRRKTGALITFALLAGGILANQPPRIMELLKQLSQHLGLAFQIRDDLLDVTSSKEALGKEVGRDQALQKSTYPALLGIEGTQAALAAEVSAAMQLVTEISKETPTFDCQLFQVLIAKFH